MSQDVKEDSKDKIGYWIKWIKAAKKAAKRHWDDSKAAYKEYDFESLKEDDSNAPRGYPIYASSCWTLEPAYYARTPKVKSKRMYGIEDEMALTMSLIADRTGQHLINNGHFDDGMIGGRGDLINAAKATTQVIYKTKTEKINVPLMQTETGYVLQDGTVVEKPLFDEMGNAYIEEERAIEDTQEIILAPLPFDEVLHTPQAKTQSEITEMAYKFCMPKEEAEARFNPKGDRTLPYKSGKGVEDGNDEEETDKDEKFLEGWEVHCKSNKKVYCVSEELKTDFLDVKDDPLGIVGFFPSPPFIITQKRRKSLYPTPIFVYLEATANQLHKLYERIFRLIESVRRRAIVDGASSELIQALNNLDGEEYISGRGMSELLEKGGLSECILWVPVQELVSALSETIAIEDHFKQNFSEWFGVPDILRGISDPAETAEAQSIKSDAANDRFKYNKKQMLELARNSAEIMLDVALKVYSDEKIAKICGYEYLPAGTPAMPPDEENPQGVPAKPGHKERFFEALTRLRNDQERLVRIDFETDSTSFRDDAKEMAKQNMVSNTLIQGLSVIGGMENREFADVALSSLLGVLNAMGGSSESEDMIKKAVSDLEKRKSQPAPPPPDYDSMKIELETQKLRLQAQGNQIDSEIQAKQLMQQDAKIQIESFKAQSDQQLAEYNSMLKAQIEQALLAIERERLDIERFKAQVQAQESMLEEVRLRQEANVNLIKEVQAAQAARIEAPTAQPPQIIQVAAPELPAMTFNIDATQKGGASRKIFARDEMGQVTEMIDVPLEPNK